MTEAELLEVVALYNVNAASYMAIFLTVTFAYLTAAYFQGSKLSSFQVAMVSGLYVLWSGVLAVGVYENTLAWENMVASQPTILNTSSLYGSGIFHFVAILIHTGSIGISLYFMYDVRKKKIAI